MRRTTNRFPSGRILGAALVAVVFCGAPASAATFVVTKTADTADGVCDQDCSLREALVAANGSPGPDTIELSAGVFALTRGGADSFAAVGDLDVRESVTISGAGSGVTIVDAVGLSPRERVIELDPCTAPGDCPGPSVVSLVGVTLRGGSAPFGGAVFVPVGSTLALTNAEIIENQAANGAGLFVAGTVTITGSALTGNAAVTTGSMNDGFGGGLFVAPGASATLVDAVVAGNTASRNGGGTYAGGTLVASQGEFTGNQAGGIGGAIEGTGSLTLTGTRVAGNTGEDGGGVAYVGLGTATLTGVEIEDNTADGTTTLGGGGGVFLFSGTMTITDSTIVRNTAFGEGGGGVLSAGALSITDTTLTENLAALHDGPLPPTTNAPGFGGGVLLIEGGTATIVRVGFLDNEAGKSGGAIYQDRSASAAISESTFTGNHAIGLFGGAIVNEGDLELSGSTLSGNTAGLNGGALSTSVGTATVDGCTLSENQAGVSGGAVYHFAGEGGSLTLTDSHLLDNDAAALGGGLLNQGVAIVTGGSIAGNEATQTGGGVYNTSSSTLTLTGVQVADNVAATGNGGGIWNDGTLEATDVAIEGNQAIAPGSGIGGGLGNQLGTAQLLRTIVHGNTAQAAGGLFNFNDGTLLVEASTVSGNTALGPFGGGIQNQAVATLQNVTVSGNTAGTAGSGLMSALGGETEVVHVTFADNLGAGISALYLFDGAVTASNTLVAGSCTNQGTLDSLGGNLEGPGNTCSFGDSSDQRNVASIGIGPLAVAGGSTATHALLPGSPAIDAAVALHCLATDQRGIARPFDGDGVDGAACDIGAVELPEPARAAFGIAFGTLAGFASARRPNRRAGRRRLLFREPDPA